MKMIKTALSGAAFSVVALASVAPAQAAPTITSPTTLTLVDLGTGNGNGFQSNATRVGANAIVTFSGATTGLYSGSSTTNNGLNGYTSPFGAGSNTNYYAVEPNGSVTITYTAARDMFGLLIGTLDSYNNIAFSTAGIAGVQSFSGTDIATALGMASNGTTNKNVLFSGLNSYNTVTLTDTTASAFEFVQASSAVPEPAAWAMMILGMGAVGFAMRRRQKVSTRVSHAV